MMQTGALSNRLSRDDDPATLTARQRDVLQVVSTYYHALGEACPASYVSRRLSLDHSTIRQHIQSLHRKGWLRGPNTPAVPVR